MVVAVFDVLFQCGFDILCVSASLCLLTFLDDACGLCVCVCECVLCLYFPIANWGPFFSKNNNNIVIRGSVQV